MEVPKLFEKPPFANYDVVVYFGGGLFAIPFLNRYVVVPLKIHWPKFEVDMSTAIAGEIVAGLALLFTIYIIGHIIAYLASQLVEKALDSVLGKTSSAVILSSIETPNRNDAIRALIYSKLQILKRQWKRAPHIVRFAFHAPMAIIYVFIFWLGIFGYYKTRIPSQVITIIRQKVAAQDWDGLRVGLRAKWFKPLEYFVICNDPAATLRMYNYLVIGGLFRTVSFIFLCAVWAQLYYGIHYLIDGDEFLKPILSNSYGISLFVEFGVTVSTYIFSLFSFVKFQRRYVEEAIFAFAFSKEAG